MCLSICTCVLSVTVLLNNNLLYEMSAEPCSIRTQATHCTRRVRRSRFALQHTARSHLLLHISILLLTMLILLLIHQIIELFPHSNFKLFFDFQNFIPSTIAHRPSPLSALISLHLYTFLTPKPAHFLYTALSPSPNSFPAVVLIHFHPRLTLN